MFGGGTTNPYDEIVAKTTDENLTSENWELIMNLCDKVIDEGQDGAHNVIAAILKRLAHRNPNVQLYALTLAESLSKNCTIELHREIASRAFTQALEKLITDRTTHDKVRRRALGLIAEWTTEFQNDSTLGVMEDCYNNLKTKNYKFEAPQEPPPPAVDDEIRRKEEEELQRVLEMSMHDKGGRGHWQQYSLATSSSASGSGSRTDTTSSVSTSHPTTTSASTAYSQPLYQSGYVPARTPSPKTQSPVQPAATMAVSEPAASVAPAASTSTSVTDASAASMAIVTRVRALHTFEPTEPGELAFEKGDIIKVVDRGYKDWWRGQLKGRTGIFPVNYVEPMPEPTVAELAKEAEQEAAVFAQAVNVEKLLTMLRSLDPAKDNLADNEEIQELYRSCMALRPKIVKLIDKYSQKRADLVSMNETFVRARSIFDRMMEESLARHTGVYDQPSYRPAQYPPPDSRGREYTSPGPQTFGWNPAVYDQPGYNAFPAPASAYGPGPVPEPAAYAGVLPAQSQPQAPAYIDPNAYAHQGQQQPPPAQQQQMPVYSQPPPTQQPAPGYSQSQPYGAQQQSLYGGQGPTPYGAPQVQSQSPPQQQQPLAPVQSQMQIQTQAQPHPHPQPQPLPLPHQFQESAQSVNTQPIAYATQESTAGSQPEVQLQDQTSQSFDHVQPQAQVQQLYEHAQPRTQDQQTYEHLQPQTQVQPEAQVQQSYGPGQPQGQLDQSLSGSPQQADQGGPPYVFDPSCTYSDPNVQAWAQYYAAGGKDPAGAVYFVSVPGVKEGLTGSSPMQQPSLVVQQQAHPQQAQQASPNSPSAAHTVSDDSQPQGHSAGAIQQASSNELPGYQSQPQAQTQPQLQTAATGTASFSTPSWVLPRHPAKSTSPAPSHNMGSTVGGSPTRVQPGHRTSLDQSLPGYAGAPISGQVGMNDQATQNQGSLPDPRGPTISPGSGGAVGYGQYHGAPRQQFAGSTLSDSGPQPNKYPGVGAPA